MSVESFQHIQISDENSKGWHSPRMGGRRRIVPHQERKLFLAEWRESRGLTQKELGAKFRPKVADMTVSRWETGESKMNTDVMAAVAEMLGIEPEDLYHDPAVPSANMLLRDQTGEVVDHALKMIKSIRRN